MSIYRRKFAAFKHPSIILNHHSFLFIIRQCYNNIINEVNVVNLFQITSCINNNEHPDDHTLRTTKNTVPITPYENLQCERKLTRKKFTHLKHAMSYKILYPHHIAKQHFHQHNLTIYTPYYNDHMPTTAWCVLYSYTYIYV